MPQPLQQTIVLLDGRYTVNLLVQFFQDRVWIVVSVDGFGTGTVVHVTPDSDAQIMAGMPTQAGDDREVVATAPCPPGGDEADDEEKEYLRSIQPQNPIDLAQVEPLLGLRDDPLTNIICQRLGNTFSQMDNRRPFSAHLGPPPSGEGKLKDSTETERTVYHWYL